MKTTHYFHFIIGCLLFLISLLTIDHREDRIYSIGYMTYSTSPAVSVPHTRLAGTSGILPVASPMVTERVSLTKEPILDKGEESATTGAHTLTAAFTYALGEAYITGLEGSLRQETALTITGIEDASLPRLNPGMVNVTGGQTGYRMLPHGMKFSKDITVVLPYDTSLLPPGFRAEEIMTYYYDEQHRSWIAIERDSVDTENRVVVSRVDHFTDFINAVIRTPEMPETQAYVPTEMSGLQAMDPLSSFTLISPPVANNQGTANLHYPLELPAGRQGMEPNLALTYNSGGGNGWMGMGWDISIPAISVDTRWGVPRYDGQLESELYLLNGEQLATKDASGKYDPLVHRAPFQSRQSGDVRFYPRTEGAFQCIIRHGNSPKYYWWEVKDKDGMTYYYGKKADLDEVDPACVLRDAYGNVARWCLTEVRDLHGNFIRYHYETGYMHGGKSIHVSRITYTGHDRQEGKYTVLFERSSRELLGFKDVQSSGRYGLLEVEGELLTGVKVYYKDELIRGYEFDYYAPNRKVLLKSLRDLTARDLPAIDLEGEANNAVELRTLVHTFQYHNGGINFEPAVTVEAGDDDTGGPLSRKRETRATSLGGVSSANWNAGGALTAGFGVNPAEKGGTGGGNYNRQESGSEGLLALLDLDGDGLPDKLFKNKQDGNKLYFRKQYLDGSTYKFGAAKLVEGIGSFMQEDGVSNNWGLEAHVTIFGVGATASGIFSNGKGSTNIYFSDVDADGLPDIVRDGRVYYNRANADGVPRFMELSGGRIAVAGQPGCDSVYIYNDVGVNESLFRAGDTAVVERVVSEGFVNLVYNGDFELGNTGFTSQLTYVAPPRYDCNSNCYTITTKNYDADLALRDHTYGNGQGHYFTTYGGENKTIWEQTIAVEPGQDYDFGMWYAIIKDSAASSFLDIYINNNLIGQVIYYEDNIDLYMWRNYKASWNSGNSQDADIKIVYNGHKVTFALDDISFVSRTGLEYVEYDTVVTPARTIFMPDHDAVKMWRAPYTGKVRITGDACLTADLMEARMMTPVTDGVKVSIQHNGQVIGSDLLSPLDSSRYCYRPDMVLNVNKGDRLYFRLESTESRLYDKVHWVPDIVYETPELNREWNFSQLDPDRKDVNGHHIYRFNAQEDFLINPERKYYMPMDGRIKIESIFTANTKLSDNIRLEVYHNNRLVKASSQFGYTHSPLHDYPLDMDLTVRENDSVWFVVSSNTNVDWQNLRWDIKFYYTQVPVDIPLWDTESDPAKPLLCYDNVVPYMTSYSKPVFPTYIYNCDYRIDISEICVAINGNLQGHYPILLTIKDDEGLCLQQHSILDGGLACGIRFPNYSLSPHKTYYFDIYMEDENAAEMITSIGVIYAHSDSLGGFPCGLHTRQKDEDMIFGDMYRNWGQFTYRKDIGDGDAIVESRLKLPVQRMTGSPDNITGLDTSDLSSLERQLAGLGIYNPLDDHFLMMDPDYRNRRWTGYGNITYISADTFSNTYSSQSKLSSVEYPYVHALPGEIIPAIKKQRFTDSKAGNFGATFPMAQYENNKLKLAGSTSSGEITEISDYRDMNGDGYPDILGETKIQYSKPQGGLSDLEKGHYGIEQSTYTGKGGNFGASFLLGEARRGALKNGNRIELQGGAGVSTGGGTINDQVHFTLLDINGDGLPDQVYPDGTVRFNLGYRYSEGNLDIRGGAVRKGNSGNFGASAGGNATVDIINEIEREAMDASNRFNLFQGSISGGLGFNSVINKSDVQFIDINNDGLPDILYQGSRGIEVAYNLGNGFSDWEQLINGHTLQKSVSYSGDLNGALSVGFTLGFLPVKLVTNPGGGGTWSTNKTQCQFIDMNGDGYPDYVVADKKGKLNVYYNRGGKENLLKQVSVGVEGMPSLVETEIDYRLTQNSYDSPQRMWVMSSVERRDDQTTVRSECEYEDPYYDRYEREHLGFGTVKVMDVKGDGNVYRVLTSRYHNREHMRKGLKHYELLSEDLAGEKKYIEKIWHYALCDIATGYELSSNSFCYGEGYPGLIWEEVLYYEGEPWPLIITSKEYQYGPYGNIVYYINNGSNRSNEKLYTEILYHEDDNNRHLVGIPVKVSVYDDHGLVRLKEVLIDEYTGKVNTMHVYSSPNEKSTTDYKYDIYGNVSELELPENLRGQRMKYEYGYDPEVHTYVTRTGNSYGHVSSAVYDYKWGKPLVTTDINGVDIRYKYDHRGRPLKIKGPYERDYTIKYYYSVDDLRWRHGHYSNSYAVAQTVHYDFFNREHPLSTVVISNGFTRHQVKKDSEVDGDPTRRVVSGRTYYDEFGRVITQYDPVVEWQGMYLYNNDIERYARPTRYTYDLLDRQTSVTLPDGSQTTMNYGFNYSREDYSTYFNREVTDARGFITSYLTDYRGLQKEVLAPEDANTYFDYNALGELVRTINPDGVPTYYEYDMQGRNTVRKHIDAGEERYGYDPAGNLVSKHTANLDLYGFGPVEYDYEYNRLTGIRYPGNPQNNVTYRYDLYPNGTGRINEIEDAAGLQRMKYGLLGEVTEHERVFVLPHEQFYAFTMKYRYDTWNRISSMEYPDGERVRYEYGRGGHLKNVIGWKPGHNEEYYLQNMEYDKFGKVYYRLIGDIDIKYDYDELQRLRNESFCLQIRCNEVNYSYDAVGNIEKIDRTVYIDNQPYKTHNMYDYDGLNRLINSNGIIKDNSGYSLMMDYSPAGRINSKSNYSLNGNEEITGYDRSYYHYDSRILEGTRYDQGKPSQIMKNGNVTRLKWDENGNLTEKSSNGMGQAYYWDEENRLTAMYQGDQFAYYVYDAGGERVFKNLGLWETMNISGRWYDMIDFRETVMYPFPYIVATPKGYTKHYYAGYQRICSKIGGGGLSELKSTDMLWEEKHDNDREAWNNYFMYYLGFDDSYDVNFRSLFSLSDDYIDELFTEDEAYYYHTDHLGSSTEIVHKEKIIQKLEYLPFGELWSDKRYSGSWEAPYTFSGKERDSETGFSYFGARYYDSDMNIWLSVDPMLDALPYLSPYVYCSNNPIGRVDPDGRLDDWYENKNGKAVWDKNVTKNNVPVDGKYIGPTVEYTENGRLYRGNRQGEMTSTDLTVTIRANNSYNQNSYRNNLSLNEISWGVSLTSSMYGEAASSAVKISEVANEVKALKVFGKVSKIAKGAGIAGAMVGTTASWIDYNNNPSTANKARASVNTVMSGVGLFYPWGTAASIVWGFIDLGWGDKIFKEKSLDQNNNVK